MRANPNDKICSFCGNPWQEGSDLFGGHGAFICDECVARFARHLEDPATSDTIAGEPWRDMTNEELLQVLPSIVATANQVDVFLHDWVGYLRERKISWQQIGLALGVSRQAVWERFTRPKRGPVKPAADAVETS